MASSVNKVILVGRLGKDPEIRSTSGGKSVANFSLATDESYKNNDGEKVKKTEWHNIVVWGPSVDNFISQYIHKGDLIYVEGELQTRSWEDKQGEKRYTTEVNVSDIKLLSSSDPNTDREARPAAQGRSQSRPAAHTRSATTRQAPPEVSDEDMPF